MLYTIGRMLAFKRLEAFRRLKEKEQIATYHNRTGAVTSSRLANISWLCRVLSIWYWLTYTTSLHLRNVDFDRFEVRGHSVGSCLIYKNVADYSLLCLKFTARLFIRATTTMSLNLSLFTTQRQPARPLSCDDASPAGKPRTSPSSSTSSPQQTTFQEFLSQFYGTGDWNPTLRPCNTSPKSSTSAQRSSPDLPMAYERRH